jgi:hypothetical protein
VPIALRFLVDLGEVALWLVALGLAMLLAYLVRGVGNVVVRVADHIPYFGGTVAAWFQAAEDATVEALNDLRHGADAEFAKALNGLKESFYLAAGLTIALGLGVKAAFEALWHHELRPLIRDVAQIPGAITHVGSALYKAVTHDVYSLLDWFNGTIVAHVRHDVATLEHDVYGTVYPTARHALHEAQAVEAMVAKAVAVGAAEWPHLGEWTWDELNDHLHDLPLRELLGMVAAVPLVYGLIHVLAREAGLDSARCRAKNKGICGTDPRLWENLLAGLVPLGIAFDLKDLMRIAERLAGELAPLIREAA